MASGKKNSTLNRRDMGLTGAVIVLTQVIASFQSNRNLSQDIDKLNSEFRQVRHDQEKYFVKKAEFKSFEHKIDKQLAKIDSQIKGLRSDYASNFKPPEYKLQYDLTSYNFKFKPLKTPRRGDF